MSQVLNILLFTISVASFEPQRDTIDGIFLTIDTKECPHQEFSYDKKKVCIANRPIIPIREFAYMTEIKKDWLQRKYFNLVFTPTGYQKLKTLATALPNAQFAILVNNQLIGFVKNADMLNSRILKVDAPAGGDVQLNIVHEKLKEILPVRDAN